MHLALPPTAGSGLGIRFVRGYSALCIAFLMTVMTRS